MRKTWSIGPMIILVATALLAAGCGGEEAPEKAAKKAADEKMPRYKKAKTPKDLVDVLHDTLVDGKTEEFMRRVSGSKEEKQVVQVLADYIAASAKFKADFVKAYGEEAWTAYRDGEGRKLKLIEEPNIDEPEVEGDEATVRQAGFGQPLKLTRQDKLWRVKAESFKPKGVKKPDVYIKMAEALTAAIRDANAKIDPDDTRPEDIEIVVPESMTTEEKE